MTNKTSFGEYFDAQRIRIEKAMQNKNTELHKAWREDYDKRQRVRDLAGLREEDEEEINTDSLQNEEKWENEGGVTLPYVDDNTPREELDSWTKTTAKVTAKGITAKEAAYVDESTQLFWWESIGT